MMTQPASALPIRISTFSWFLCLLFFTLPHSRYILNTVPFALNGRVLLYGSLADLLICYDILICSLSKG